MIVCIGLKRRLELFRSENEVDTTVLNYFDEFEIHPDHIGAYIPVSILLSVNCHTLYIQTLRRTVAVGWSKQWSRLRS